MSLQENMNFPTTESVANQLQNAAEKKTAVTEPVTLSQDVVRHEKTKKNRRHTEQRRSEASRSRGGGRRHGGKRNIEKASWWTRHYL
ncbi:hypothetical protein F2Q69_00011596 [Brassica cretica]|uniref:Uncharacterized protein n=1 Tax=Brassica cretica TaxID=69181 RepID=A0A8S9QV34_BRACR|nr:hypothetical protein F2Q69_00011596 [Brassica cretica]